MLGRRLINAFLRAAFRIMMRLEVRDLQNAPLSGRQILMFDHVNFLDAPIIASVWPREVETLTKAENLRSGILAPFMRLYGAFPVNRGEVDRRALASATWALESDRVLLISPEGTRSRGRGLGKGKDGMALLAVRTGSPLVPIAVWGQEEVIPSLLRLRRARVHVQVGRPFRFDNGPSGKIDRAAVRQMTAESMYLLSAMLPERYRGLYSDLSQATSQYIRYDGEDVGAEGATTA
jgi:1-acyl-sn-glycerol-3-phosphate acyltransferase